MPNNIITVAPRRLGDSVFCTPLLRFLKTLFPQAAIDVIVYSKASEEVFSFNPHIRLLWRYPTDAELSSKKTNYDLIINMHNSPEAERYLSFFTAVQRIDFNDSSKQFISEKQLSFFSKYFKYELPKDYDKHYELYPQKSHDEQIREYLNESPRREQKNETILVGFHLGCHGLSKKRSRLWNKWSHEKVWPLKRYIQLANLLQQYDDRIRIVLTGSKEEKRLGELFCKKVRAVINLIQQTTVLEAAALMAYLDLFVSNDTGLLHVACAYPLPVIAIFGQSEPQETGPYPPASFRVVFHNRDIGKIKAEQVFEQAKQLVNMNIKKLELSRD